MHEAVAEERKVPRMRCLSPKKEPESTHIFRNLTADCMKATFISTLAQFLMQGHWDKGNEGEIDKSLEQS